MLFEACLGNTIDKTPRRLWSPQVSAQDMARLGAVFATVDADGSGTVTLQVWKELFIY